MLSGLLFIGALLLLSALLSLPFSVHATFVVEERFGFNRTTPRTFVLDRLKALALAAALGGPLLAAVLAIFAHAGRSAWLVCWAAVAGYTLVVQFVAPTWIMPLFNTFTPLRRGGAARAHRALRGLRALLAGEHLPDGRVAPLEQVQRLLHRFRQAPADRPLRHARGAAHRRGSWWPCSRTRSGTTRGATS